MNPPSFIEERYRRETPTSAALMVRAAGALPGGNTRTTSFHPPYPVVIERADGPWLWDVDQRRYLDLFCNGLSLIHGNNFAPARAAIADAIQRGMAWSGTSRDQIAYAELLRDRIGALQLLRFTNSGSEAGMLAVKAARHITGRPYIVKAVGAYHGCYPDLEAGLYGQGDLAGRALVAPFNDLDGFESVMVRHGRDVAAIVIEPVLVTGRVVPPAPGFLSGLQSLARRHGAMTILDDCLMLRLAVGGSAEKFLLQPDIVMLDDFSEADLAAAVARNRARTRPVKLEASGGVTLETVMRTARTGVDYISIGALTKHVHAIDLSLRLDFASPRRRDPRRAPRRHPRRPRHL